MQALGRCARLRRCNAKLLGLFGAFAALRDGLRLRHGRSSRAATRTGTPRSREVRRRRSARPSLPSAARNTTVEGLNKILSASQLSPVDRSLYLSLRAFVYSRLGREADSQKDVAEMGQGQPAGLAGR